MHSAVYKLLVLEHSSSVFLTERQCNIQTERQCNIQTPDVCALHKRTALNITEGMSVGPCVQVTLMEGFSFYL
jgi:hypothetical protein